MRECLVIIDVQNGFITKDTALVPLKIQQLTNDRQFATIVATRFVNTKESPHYIFTHWDEMMDLESQKLDVFVASIANRVFDKNINTCFTDDFLDYIKVENIEKLVFVGIDTDCCVMKSAFDSFDRKIPFEVLTDYCSSTGGHELHLAACRIMKRSLGESCVR